MYHADSDHCWSQQEDTLHCLINTSGPNPQQRKIWMSHCIGRRDKSPVLLGLLQGSWKTHEILLELRYEIWTQVFHLSQHPNLWTFECIVYLYHLQVSWSYTSSYSMTRNHSALQAVSSIVYVYWQVKFNIAALLVLKIKHKKGT